MRLLYDWSMLFFILSTLIQKPAQQVIWDGSKIIFIVFLEERAVYTAVVRRWKGFFFCQSPVAAFPGGRRTYEGWHEGKQSSWIMSVVFGASFLFDIIGDIPAWPRESDNYGKKLYPRANSSGHVIFVHCLLNWMLTTNICPTLTHPRKALRKPCGRSAQVFHPVHYVGLHLVVGLWSLLRVSCGLRRCDVNSQLRNADV